MEYQFPATLLDTKSSTHHQHFHEVMRVASKKLQDGSGCGLPLTSIMTSLSCSYRDHLQPSLSVSCAAEQQAPAELVEQGTHLQGVLPTSATENGTTHITFISPLIFSTQPYLVGKAVASLKTWLTSSSLQSHASLPVHSSSLADALHTSTPTQPSIGHLQVREGRGRGEYYDLSCGVGFHRDAGG